MMSVNLLAPGGQAGRQPIVSSFGQRNVIPALIITAVTFLLYYDGLRVYIHGDLIWFNFSSIEAFRSKFYLSGSYVLPRPVEYAIEDLIRFIFGLDNPLPFHAIVLGLHVANSIFVFLILKKVIDAWVGLFGTLLFTSFFAHPEVVTYHYGIGEALRAFFLLSCIMLFYRYRREPTRTDYVLTLGAFILAIGSRESSAGILPPLMYLVDRYLQMESKTEDVKLSKGVYIPFIMTSVAWMIVFFVVWNEPRTAAKIYLNWTEWSINLYLSTITSFNLCFFKGPGYGTLVLILSLMLSFLPLFDARTRRCLILLWAGWLVTIIPLISVGMNLRYLYITSAFSMAIFATCICHLIIYVTGRSRSKEAYTTFLSILVFAAPLATNFFYVGRHVEYLKDTGRLSEYVLKHIFVNFPMGTQGTKLVFINFPYFYEPKLGTSHVCTRHVIWWDFLAVLASVYGRRNVGATYQFTLPELYDGRHPLALDMPKLSSTEFEKLAIEKGTKVYLFNPRNDTILDVAGRDYDSLKKLMSIN